MEMHGSEFFVFSPPLFLFPLLVIDLALRLVLLFQSPRWRKGETIHINREYMQQSHVVSSTHGEACIPKKNRLKNHSTPKKKNQNKQNTNKSKSQGATKGRKDWRYSVLASIDIG